MIRSNWLRALKLMFCKTLVLSNARKKLTTKQKTTTITNNLPELISQAEAAAFFLGAASVPGAKKRKTQVTNHTTKSEYNSQRPPKKMTINNAKFLPSLKLALNLLAT